MASTSANVCLVCKDAMDRVDCGPNVTLPSVGRVHMKCFRCQVCNVPLNLTTFRFENHAMFLTCSNHTSSDTAEISGAVTKFKGRFCPAALLTEYQNTNTLNAERAVHAVDCGSSYIETSSDRFMAELRTFQSIILAKSQIKECFQDVPPKTNCITSNHLNTNKLCECDEKFWIEIPAQYDLTPIEIELHEDDIYRVHFSGYDHWNYYTVEDGAGPCILSFKQEVTSGTREHFRILVRGYCHIAHGLLQPTAITANRYERDEVVRAVGKEMGFTNPFVTVSHHRAKRELLKLDEAFFKRQFKVGVVYLKEFQSNEEEIFSNQPDSPRFEDFLRLLGKRVTLKGFKGFRGGLDAISNQTGTESVYTTWRGSEFMFHVSTLLPYSYEDLQQLQRKRHIGNDIVCVVFLDGPTVRFRPSCIKSHFLHVFIVVRPVAGGGYNVALVAKNGVQLFGAQCSPDYVFQRDNAFRDFILCKIVNGQHAAYNASKFKIMIERTRHQMLGDLVQKFRMDTESKKRECHMENGRGTWLPFGAVRPQSPLLDAVFERYENANKLGKDLENEYVSSTITELCDVVIVAGKSKSLLFGIRAIMAVRCRVFQKLLVNAPLHDFDSRLLRPKERREYNLNPGDYPRKKGSTSIHGEKHKITLPKVTVEEFNCKVMSVVLQYIHTGSCYIVTSHLPSLIAAADRFDLPELREACLKILPSAISFDTIIDMLNAMEFFIQYKSVKSMLQKLLEFIDQNIRDVLSLPSFCNLSEHVLQLVFARDLDIDEIAKFNAAIRWGKNFCAKQEGRDMKTVLQQLVNKIQFHLIKPRELMQVVYPAGVVPDHKLIVALAFQADPRSVEGIKGAPVLEHTV
ncbi:uncharacterized protein LOC134822379 [Bolinopsis microptera]|uniref:uncharacterized protein LOC134822379 n=1 Tax=Bolinopsis microptera TaxID=2820187 RepID=UPI00307A2327